MLTENNGVNVLQSARTPSVLNFTVPIRRSIKIRINFILRSVLVKDRVGISGVTESLLWGAKGGSDLHLGGGARGRDHNEWVHSQKLNGGQWGIHGVNGGSCPPGPPPKVSPLVGMVFRVEMRFPLSIQWRGVEGCEWKCFQHWRISWTMNFRTYLGVHIALIDRADDTINKFNKLTLQYN